jgi:hypothetical protein
LKVQEPDAPRAKQCLNQLLQLGQLRIDVSVHGVPSVTEAEVGDLDLRMLGCGNQPFFKARPNDDNAMLPRRVTKHPQAVLVGLDHECRQVGWLGRGWILINHGNAALTFLQRVADAAFVVVMQAITAGHT